MVPGDDQNTVGQGSLLEGLGVTSVLPKPTFRERLNAWSAAKVRAVRAWANATPGRAHRVRLAGRVGLAAVVVGALVGGYLAIRERPQPDVFVDPFDDVLDYTLLSEEFNRLSTQKRLEIITDLVKRFRSMDGSESVLVAAFAAGIQGEARKQLERNMSRLVLDVVDEGASAYDKASPEDKERVLDESYVRLVRTIEALDGEPTSKTDDEILQDGRKEAERGAEWARNTDRDRLGRQTGRMLLSVNDTIGQQASPQQRGRMTVLMRDMTRRFRGE
jgi:hypothetical protein